MTADVTIPEFIAIALGLSAAAFVTLAWIMWIQFPPLASLIRRYGRFIWVKRACRKRGFIAEYSRLERNAQRIEGDVLYFD